MALRTIVQDGDPILKKVCRPVTKFDDRLGILLDDMKETLLDANGLGLAGPQVGMMRRLFICLDDRDLPKEVPENYEYKFIEFNDLGNLFFDVKKGVICATICSVTDKSYKDRQSGCTKHFGKIELQQNTDTNILTIWDDWDTLKHTLKNAAGKIIIAVVNVKWSDYDEKNTLQIGKSLFTKLL